MPESSEGTHLSKILLVDDDKRFAESVVTFFSQEHEVSTVHEPTEAMKVLAQLRPDLVLLDFGLPQISGLEFLKLLKRRMPELPVVMLTGNSQPETIIETMKAGASDFVIKGSDEFAANLKFRVANVLEKTAILRRNRTLIQENETQFEKNRKLAAKLATHVRSYEILGVSEATLKLRRDILRMKGTHSYVLISGENGTGKELVARNLNLQEDDPSRPFIAVNCAAIPANLFESELFGHAKGAFTGASEAKPGQFKLADGGDIFLDEIGEIPLEMQAKLLRVLQEQTFTPVGAIKSVTVNVRVIAATNRDLEVEIKKGRFREDLFYRLNQISLRVPALRERSEDIEYLAEEFLKRRLPMGKISVPARKVLAAYPWRGNIRELQNAVERAYIDIKDSARPVLKPEHLGLDPNAVSPDQLIFIPEGLLPRSKEDVSAEQFQSALEWMERLYLASGLKLFEGNNRFLYTLLGMSKAAYFNRKKRLLGETAETEEAVS
jgi:DNA-binding NtrC family response regulator